MPNYRRYYVPGGTYFFTVVTCERRPLFAEEGNRALLRKAIDTVMADHPVNWFASVLLPDHLHAVWVLPPGDANYSMRWRRIKEEFTESYLAAGGKEAPRSRSRVRHGERAVWQRRFWEHTCFDVDDLQRCVDYIHYNPVKHGYVKRPGDWQWSTFLRFVAAGDYQPTWGDTDPYPNYNEPEWE